ncbi:MAG TPA: hypothetical protein VG328_05475 [Stellaceae bacterium]|jgi:hypothetical protein|nr:hypothetical protein [Stellaceae bacterium]
MAKTLLDDTISAGWPETALLALFEGEVSPVRIAAQYTIPVIIRAAARFGRQWLIANAKHLTPDIPRAIRIAATRVDGIELALRYPLTSGPTWAATPAGAAVIVFQIHAGDRDDLREYHLEIVARNLAIRRPRVPVRPSEGVIRDEAAA